MKFIPNVFFLVSAIFWLLLLSPNTAYSQQPAPRTYLFVEVKDTSGKAVDDATVTLDGRVASKTNKDGVAEASFLQWSKSRHYDLQISKAGYLTSEHVVFPYCYFGRDAIYTRESFPNSAEDLKNCKSIPTSVMLLRTPITAAERQSTEPEERKRQLMLAAKKGDETNLRKLLEAGMKPATTDNEGVSAIAWAAFSGNAETIKALLNAGADVRSKNSLGHQALLIYLTEGLRDERNLEEGEAAVQQREEVVRRLVEVGANLNVPGSYRGTVLTRAIHLSPYAAQTYLSQASYYLLLAHRIDQTTDGSGRRCECP